MPNFLKARLFRKAENKTPKKKNKNVTTPSSVNTNATAMETPDRRRHEDDDDDEDDDSSSQSSSHSSSQSSGSSSGTELPWDVEDSADEHSLEGKKGRRKKKDAGKDAVNNNNNNTTTTEDEDNQTSRSMLNLGKRTMRPLSPPAQAGLPKDGPDGNDNNNNNTTGDNNNLNPEGPYGEEEMPMDEKEQDQKQQALCGLGAEGEASMSADYLCDYTISALNGICGISPTHKPSPEDDEPAVSSSKDTSSPKQTTPPKQQPTPSSASKTAAARALIATRFKPPYGVEEQTAIEVEYIEPPRRDRERDETKSEASSASVGANPKTKQLLVQAMARRAKQEFETQKGRPAHVASPTSTSGTTRDLNTTMDSEDTNASPPTPPDNVYSTFTSSEKRKFLKLINTGLTPIEATVQVLRERQEPETEPELEVEQQELEPELDHEPTHEFTTTAPEESLPDVPPPDQERSIQEPEPEPLSQPPPAIQPQLLALEVPPPKQLGENEKEEEPFAKSGINYYDAVRKEAPEEWMPEELAPSVQSKAAKQRRRPRPRLSKFAFFRPGAKGKQLVEEEPPSPPKQTRETVSATATARSQQDPPPVLALNKQPPQQVAQQQQPQSLPEPQSRPTTTALNQAPNPTSSSVPDMEEAAEKSRSIFKPIQVTPTPMDLPPSLSQDSLLDGMDEPPPEDDYYFDDNEEDDEEDQQQQLMYAAQQQQRAAPEPEIVVGQARGVQQEPSTKETAAQEEALPDQEDNHVDNINDLVPSAPEPELPNQPEQKEEEILVPRDTQDHFINESFDNAMEEDLAAKLLGVSMSSQMPRSPARPMANEAINLDVDTSYLNSTDVMSHYNQGTSVMGDQTVRTTGTYGTAGTNYTTSTRSRRPGASKQRLTSQKTGESLGNAKKFKGWQESIQAAAAGIGRVWDPVKGWVDFKDMEDEKKLDDSVTIPFSLQPHTPKIARKTGEIQEQAPRASPDSLEVQGEEMVMEEQAYSHQVHSRAAATTSPPRSATTSPPRSAVTSPPKSRGWMQTMKEATARIDTQGKRWDPERGWVGLHDDDATPYVDRYRSDVDEPGLSDTQDFGTLPQPKQLDQQAYLQSQPQSMPMPMPGVAREPRDPTGQKPITHVRKDPNGHVLHADDDHLSDIQSVDASTKSGTAGRYVQIGDTGSVSSYYFGKASAATRTPNREMASPLASTPENAESHKDEDASTSTVPASGRTSLLVNVKKEKVSPADASMFPEITKGPKGTRRGPGPIDLDEIDDEENGSFGVAQDFSWDDDNFDASSGQGGTPKQSRTRSSPGKSPSEVSHSSVSTKSVPRLRAPTRDTSPIRGRGPNEQPTTPTQTAPPQPKPMDPSPSAQTPPPVPRPTRPQQKRFVPDVDSSQKPTPNQRLSNIPQDRPETGNVPQDRPETTRTAPMNSSDSEPERPPKLTEVGSDVGNDARSTYTAESSPSVNSVKRLHDYWERRSSGEAIMPQNAEWKTFLSQKVLAESNAAQAKQKRRSNYDDKDSLFDFQESEGAFPRTRKNPSLGASPRHDDPSLRSLQEISNLSPIRNVHDDDDEDDDDQTPSEVSTSVAQGTTFLQRLQACAAPILPKTMEGGVNCNPLPVAHLAFMRNNSAANSGNPDQAKSSSRFLPTGLWNKPDIIVEEDEDEQVVEERGGEARQKGNPEQQPRSSTPSGRQRGDMSSVISDEQFGQKTAYLEAIAMKAAVSGSKKNRRTRSSGSSDTGSSKHTESWQRFLDKKKGHSEDSSDVQGAAERYASEKVEEMIGSMSAARSRPSDFQPRPMEDATGAFPSIGNHNRFKNSDQFQWKNESTRAAEDLAAARVEAMMNALSSPRALDEGEAEI